MAFTLHHRTSPLVIAGPCSAETQEQMRASCLPLADIPSVNLIRAGIWKPRTRPDSFEGVGEQGLPWLKEVGEATGLPVCTEVANAHHVEACLKHDIDVLWIGARTTVNPFSVQTIADALQGVDIAVLVKNPINPDIKLWLGAVERIEAAGIQKVGAIHRGFSYYGESIYRNQPRWELAIAFRAARPDLPLICDPSHMAGRRDLLEDLSSHALDLGLDGLMIESHCNPDEAWSDASQQITPYTLGLLLDRVLHRTPNPIAASDPSLSGLRSKIDGLDEEIITLLARRLATAQEIGEYKAGADLEILQPARWREILETRTELAEKLGVDPAFILDYLDLMHKQSIALQKSVFKAQGKSDSEGIPW